MKVIPLAPTPSLPDPAEAWEVALILSAPGLLCLAFLLILGLVLRDA